MLIGDWDELDFVGNREAAENEIVNSLTSFSTF
jgi:hypothetical protein